MTGRPLRVAILGESYLPYLSGVTVATEALARGLRAAGHDVLLLVPSPLRAPCPEPPAPRGPSRVSPGFRRSRSRARPLPATEFRGRSRPGRCGWPGVPPEVVHAQSPFVSGLMARRLARQAGAPLVFTHHTRFGDYRHYLGPAAVPGGALVAEYLLRYWLGCAAVVAPGSELAHEIRDRLAPRRRPLVRAIPTGIEVAAIRALDPIDPRPLAGWPADAVVVGGLGRLAPEKSVDIWWKRSPRWPPSSPRPGCCWSAAGPPRRRSGHASHGPTWPAACT